MRTARSVQGAFGGFLGLAVGGMLTGQAVAAPGDVFDLGALPGGESSYANGINNLGQVVGYGDTDWAFHAFLYSGTPGAGGQMFDLGSLGGSTRESVAYAISDGGHVVGYSRINFTSDHAFLYTGTPGVDGQMIDLGTLPGGGDSQAFAVNILGQVVGEAQNSSGRSRAFLYSGGTMYDLGTLPGDQYSWATGINASGQIVGGSGDSRGNERVFLYTGIPGSGGSMQALPTLAGASNMWAYDINNAGQITGEAETDDGYTTFLYSNGTMYDLGNLGDPDSYSRGLAINSLGHVVGTSELGSDDGYADHAFLYIGTPGVDGQMIDLDAWLDEVNPTEGAKWTLFEAYGINDAGLIVGWGEYDDGIIFAERAFLLDASSLVPEPGSLSLAALTAATLLHRRRRR